MIAHPTNNFLITYLPSSFLSSNGFYLLSAYLGHNYQDCSNTREVLGLSVLNHEREGKTIPSSGGDRKNFEGNRNFTFINKLYSFPGLATHQEISTDLGTLISMPTLLMVT